MILFPNAKINIGLDIHRRRDDGYHEIETLMYPIGWNDILELVPAPPAQETSLNVSGHKVDCPPEKNLVMKAFRAVERHSGTTLPATAIYLHKNIPDGAGLGGGSSDAAFTIVGVNRLWNLGLDDETMAAIASEVGADCPFFIYNRPMLATGTGTHLDPADIDLSGLTVTVVKPMQSVPTAAAYRGVTPRMPSSPLRSRLDLSIDCWQEQVVNAFEESVVPAIPVIALIKESMIRAGALYTSMSGSGSAVYALSERDILADMDRELLDGMAVWSGKMI